MACGCGPLEIERPGVQQGELGADLQGRQSGQGNVRFGLELTWGGSGDFLCPGEGNIHVGVEEDSRIDRHLVVAAGQIQGQAEPSGAGVLVEGILLVIIRPGPLAVFLALRLGVSINTPDESTCCLRSPENFLVG